MRSNMKHNDGNLNAAIWADRRADARYWQTTSAHPRTSLTVDERATACAAIEQAMESIELVLEVTLQTMAKLRETHELMNGNGDMPCDQIDMGKRPS